MKPHAGRIRKVRLLSFNTMIQESSNLNKKYQEKGDLGSIKEADSTKLELVSENDMLSEESKPMEEDKPKGKKINEDLSISMFKSRQRVRLLPFERKVPFRPFSISPPERKPIIVPPIKNKLVKKVEKEIEQPNRAKVFSNSNSTRNRTLEIPSSDRARTMNQTFRTKASTNMHPTSRSNLSATQYPVRKEKGAEKWFSPKSASSTKTKKSKVELQNLLNVIL